ncbi:hypothetical protein K439DRAFT_1642648 [Ramaria rubella]|nr:hypothetical protein K439DRAFT_1642648 [Ramaria rubella]
MLLNDTIHGSIIADERLHNKFTLIADAQEWLPLLHQVYDSQPIVGFNELGAEVSHDRGYEASTVHDVTEMWLGIVLFATAYKSTQVI